MASQEVQAERIEALRALMERLCAPDLTLGDAKSLRSRLFVLLERDVQETEPKVGTSPPRFATQGCGARWHFGECSLISSLCCTAG